MPYFIQKEPFRLIFPLGVIQAFLGLSSWILFYYFPNSWTYPGPSHGVIQIQGFMGCFIFGFLITMLPSRLKLPPVSIVELGAMFSLLLGVSTFAMLSLPFYASGCFFLSFVIFDFYMLRTFTPGGQKAPDEFVLIFVAMFWGTLCSGILLATYMVEVPFFIHFAAKDFINSGWVLLLVAGVGGHLYPRLMKHLPPGPGQASKLKRFLLTAMGLIFCASYLLDQADVDTRLAHLVRLLVIAPTLVMSVRLYRWPKGQPPFLKAVWFCFLFMLLSMTLPIVFPDVPPLAWKHVLYITGFLWIVLIMISRISTAHSGAEADLPKHRVPVITAGLCIVIGMLARIGPDLMPHTRWLHMALASIFVLLGILIYIFVYAKYFFKVKKR